MTPHALPTRRLPERPDLDQLKRQAKELLKAFISAEAEAVAEVNAHYHDADPADFALHDAQLVLARAYGFESWPKLKALVDGATVTRLVNAVRADDLAQVRAMLNSRPELAQMSSDNLQVLHHAVLHRAPEMVRLLMQHGAHARDGVYPHREATSALAIATERGYDDLVAIIKEEEQRHREAKGGPAGAPEPDALFQAIGSGESDRAIAMMEANPSLIQSCHPLMGWTPLHVAAHRLNARVAAWLLDRGADVTRRGWHDFTALDLAAYWSRDESAEPFAAMAKLLLRRGAEMTPRAAAALGEAEWLRARHAEGVLVNPIEDSGGLLRIAASHDRPEILALLLDFGFDPDERTRFGAVGGDEVVFTWGMPLWQCTGSGKYGMAEMLLARGADPNAAVYASGDPVFRAFSARDWTMVELLGRYGGVACASTAGLYRQTDLARKLLAGEAAYRLEGYSGGSTLAEELLAGAACGGDPEIVRRALERVDWPRDDPRWFSILEQPLRIWSHGSTGASWDRGTYLTCFRLLLERCDPNVRGRETFGLTILHSVAGSREHVTAGERVAFATMLLDAGARLDVRDNLLLSTPLGWACRWGRIELVQLFLERGADPVEADAEAWATPRAWALKKGHDALLAVLRDHAA